MIIKHQLELTKMKTKQERPTIKTIELSEKKWERERASKAKLLPELHQIKIPRLKKKQLNFLVSCRILRGTSLKIRQKHVSYICWDTPNMQSSSLLTRTHRNPYKYWPINWRARSGSSSCLSTKFNCWVFEKNWPLDSSWWAAYIPVRGK